MLPAVKRETRSHLSRYAQTQNKFMQLNRACSEPDPPLLGVCVAKKEIHAEKFHENITTLRNVFVPSGCWFWRSVTWRRASLSCSPGR